MFEIVINTVFYTILLLPVVIIVFGSLIWMIAAVQLSNIRAANMFILELVIRVCDVFFGGKNTYKKRR